MRAGRIASFEVAVESDEDPVLLGFTERVAQGGCQLARFAASVKVEADARSPGSFEGGERDFAVALGEMGSLT